jgi:hypothetical protein
MGRVRTQCQHVAVYATLSFFCAGAVHFQLCIHCGHW